MTDWKSTIDIRDLMEKHEAKSISVLGFAKELLERLAINRYSTNDDLKEIVDELKEFIDFYDENEVDNIDLVDGILERLYDFGDTDNRIFFKVY